MMRVPPLSHCHLSLPFPSLTSPQLLFLLLSAAGHSSFADAAPLLHAACPLPPQGAFERGTHDHFSLTTPQLGHLRELTLGHDGKGLGAAWQVDTAEMEIVATGEKWWFDFKCW